jgi:hypothetical protein
MKIRVIKIFNRVGYDLTKRKTTFDGLNSILKWDCKKVYNTPAGIRTRVRALATPGDDRYTTDVLWCPDPDSNRGQLPLQGSALPLSYLGIRSTFCTYIVAS